MAHVVYARAEGDSDIKGDLFKDLKFFLAQRCPFRSTYVEKVTRNGGEVVKLEKHADILIADHAKAFDAPPGSISYKFIDESIRNGQLEDVENDEFRVGPRKGTSRPVGSIRPGKAGRTPFTPEDDRILWQWVADYKSKGGALSGLEIYKQLEATNNRHTYQSWRDRWVKNLKHKPPPAGINAIPNAPPTPPVESELSAAGGDEKEQEQAIGDEDVGEQEEEEEDGEGNDEEEDEEEEQQEAALDDQIEDIAIPIDAFLPQEFNDIFLVTQDILDTDAEDEQKAWNAWNDVAPEHSVGEWRHFWKEAVRPIWEEQGNNSWNKRIYTLFWEKWIKANPNAKADAWVEYFWAHIQPQFDADEEDEETGETPEKDNSQVSKQFSSPNTSRKIQPRIASASGSQEQMETSMDGAKDSPSAAQSLQGVKRSRTELEDDDDNVSSPSKRARQDDDANFREFIEIPDDPEEEEEEGEDNEYEDAEEDEESAAPENVAEDLPPSSPPIKYAAPPPPRQVLDTQAIVDAETQDIDFEIPLPEGGFGDKDEEDKVQYPVLPTSEPDPLGRELATQRAQGALRALAHIPSDTIDPELDATTNGETHSVRTHYETATETQSKYYSAPSSNRQLQSVDQVDKMSLNERVQLLDIQQLFQDGHSQENVLLAVKKTSADPRLFHKVLATLEAGNDAPGDVRGVWTNEDDAAVEGTDARTLQRITQKHGWQGLNGAEGRMMFLKEWRTD